ncbi:MAG: EAL domain-containing protein [Gammaproteobacteria bacterium]|nr:EAL domain-containing protein [Gammaproteobacteria bacterium]
MQLGLVCHEQGPSIGFRLTLTDRAEQHQAEQALLEAGVRYQAVLDGSKDGFLMVDTQGRVREVNDIYCSESGYSREELLQLSIADLEAQQSPAEIEQRLGQIMRDGGAIFETRHRRKDGSVWPVEVSISHAWVEGGRIFSFLRNISRRKEAEALGQLRQRLVDMLASEEPEALLQYALDQAEAMTASSVGFFHFIDEGQASLQVPAQTPAQTEVSLQVWSSRTLREMCSAAGASQHYPIGQAGVWVDCVYQRRPVLHNDYASLSHRKGLPEGHPSLVRELTLPVFRNQRIVAIIGLGNKAENYDEDDIRLASLIADLAYDFYERKRIQQQIQFMAYNDLLTGLPNRQLLADRLQQAMALSRRSRRLLAVCYLDLDGFKPVNDTYGHQAGDRVLVQLAERLQRELREEDTLARIGGDEFAILINNLDNVHQAEEVGRRLLQAIVEPFAVDGYRLHLSASIGITLFPQDDSAADILLRHADQAMYGAKQKGKNCYCLHEEIWDNRQSAMRAAVAEIEMALRGDQLLLHYQPRIELRSGELAGVEALVRWNHPHKGLLYPNQFLYLIQDSPMELALDEWVLQAAIDQHLSWRSQGLYLPISVNISPRNIQQRGFVGFLEQLLGRYPADLPGYLELEVLETCAINDTAEVAKTMKACAALGLKFALDDFGTGYSSLISFHRLPIDILKIDQNFVRAMLDDVGDQDIVEGVVRLADALHRPVVAEGVESIGLALMLNQLGCQYAQGYGIARPMPAAALVDWDQQWRAEQTWRQLSRFRQGPTEYYDLNVAIHAHQLWMEQLQAHFSAPIESQPPELGEQDCQFAHWYRGIGQERFGGSPAYPFLLARHDELHRLARELAELAPEQALNRFDELTSASAELVDLLLGLTRS